MTTRPGWPAAVAIAGWVFAGGGMGLMYPRLSVMTLALSTKDNEGFNSSAMSISDSLGGALALATTGIVFAAFATAAASLRLRGVRADGGDRDRRRGGRAARRRRPAAVTKPRSGSTVTSTAQEPRPDDPAGAPCRQRSFVSARALVSARGSGSRAGFLLRADGLPFHNPGLLQRGLAVEVPGRAQQQEPHGATRVPAGCRRPAPVPPA